MSQRGGWSIPRSDLPAGGLALARLVHPLLPRFSSLRPDPSGLRLLPDPDPPASLSRLSDPRAFAARLTALLAFLRAHGLGVAGRDVSRVGADPHDAARPALGAPPVPAWRALPPATAAAAVLARAAGITFAAADPATLRDALAGADGNSAALAARILRAEEAGTAPDALARDLAEESGSDLGADLLGLALPLDVPPGGGTYAAWGSEALFLARGAALRLGGEEGFVEVAAGALLEEGGALRRAARLLARDPRAAALSALAEGREPDGAVGPRMALVARDLELWDARSRAAWERLGALDFACVEARAAAPAPWEKRTPLVRAPDAGDVASTVWLPFRSVAEAVSSWEVLAREAHGDVARLLAAARRLARALPGRAGRPPARPRARREPALAAAALLLDGFDAAEAAAASGLPAAEASEALARALGDGVLAEEAPGRFRFADEEERARLAARVGERARREAAARLDEAALAPRWTLAAALARAEVPDVAAARAAFVAAFDGGDMRLCASLLRRAPARDAVLGEPLRAFLAFAREGRRREAAAHAEGLFAAGPLALRREAARALVRLGRVDDALRLLPSREDPAESRARVRVLLDARRDAEARRLFGQLPREAGARAEEALLEAELAARAHDYPRALHALRRAGRLLGSRPAEDAAELARTAGFLASDLRRFDESLAFFRRARDGAAGPEARADATADVAVAAFHAGRFEEAARELEAALAAFAALGDRGRYVSVLANRAELAMAGGDAAGARRDLETVLAFDRAPERAFQLLFSIPALQRLALADADLAGADAAFAEALRAGIPEDHPGRREILLREAARLLMERRPAEAAARLDEASATPDDRTGNEPLLLRLRASARIDLGEAATGGEFPRDERALLAAERALRSGTPVRGTAALEELRARRGGALAAAERVVEWAHRFPGAVPPDVLRLGRRAAQDAGLPGAAALLAAPPPRAAASIPAPAAAPATFVAEDAATRALLDVLARVAPASIPVLVLGETGTGKEVVARELHRLSRRRGSFMAVNVAALSPTLVESELFGHARGAFTGAERERTGLVEASSGGTLFLDEIGDLPLALQAKLLRVLQEREVVRVGETKPRRVDLRVAAATHRDLAAMARDGTFRFDLYQRLAGVTLAIPPLRERPRDLAALVARALDGARVLPEARRRLLAHDWPGNVRELLAAIEAARALAAGEPIGVAHLPAALRNESAPAPLSYHAGVDAAKRKLIAEALAACAGNRTHAAKRLRISRQSLLYDIRKLGL